MNEKEVMGWIEGIGQKGSVYGLESIETLLYLLGNPQKQLKFIHIAGTNGKGSVLCFISAALKAAGLRVGGYISPTIFNYRERIQVNEKAISIRVLCNYGEKIRNAAEEMIEMGLPHPTAFEIETAMAFLYFKEKRCDIVVMETGLGGALDATNIVENTIAAVFTSISMDHMGILGNNLTEIALQKAGIIKNGCYVISTRQKEEVEEVLCKKAEEAGAHFVQVDETMAGKFHYGIKKQWFLHTIFGKVVMTMSGMYQLENCMLALEVLEILSKNGYPMKTGKICEGIQKAVWHGRFEVISDKPIFVIDGAHNEDGAKKLADSIGFYFTKRKIVYIMGILKDKEYEKIIQNTYRFPEHIITITPPCQERALPSYELAQAVREYHSSVTAADSVMEAVEMSYLLTDKDSVIIAFGSLSFLGELTDIVKHRESLRSDTHGK